MRPVLKPVLRRFWRDDHTLQLGLDPQRAVVLTGLDEVRVRWLDRLDGSCDRLAWMAGAMADGLTRSEAERMLAVLDDAGALEDASLPAGPLADLSSGERDRLAPDIAALSLLGEGAAVAIARRGAAVVEVRGLGRVGSALTALLAAAGVGHVVPVDPGTVQPGDSTPGGPQARDTGLARERAVRRAVQRTAPQARLDPTDSAPALVVLAGGSPAAAAAQLVRDGVAHLVAAVNETTGVVGPLVIPGVTACVRCLDLHRTDRDPAWPRLLAQLATPPAAVAACDVVLATQVAATAAQQILVLLDSGGRSLPESANGTLELVSPGWRFRRRSWPPHPACGCGWRQSFGDDTMAG
ncbi:MAG: hypothetical protein QOJ92_19 [Frankiales bacterium]|nr:hypothetical protein [Frankiales bacterium]